MEKKEKKEKKAVLIIKMDKALKKEILELAHQRKLLELPNSTMTELVTEFILKGLERERDKK